MSNRGLRYTPAEARLLQARREGQRLALEGAFKGKHETDSERVMWATLQPLGGWEREYEFFPLRRWRFDFAQPELKIAVELDGQVHKIADRFAGDLLKHNAAQLEGWTLLRFTPQQVQ